MKAKSLELQRQTSRLTTRVLISRRSDEIVNAAVVGSPVPRWADVERNGVQIADCFPPQIYKKESMNPEDSRSL